MLRNMLILTKQLETFLLTTEEERNRKLTGIYGRCLTTVTKRHFNPLDPRGLRQLHYALNSH